MEPLAQKIFALRFEQMMPDILRPLTQLYGHLPHFPAILHRLLTQVAEGYAQRSEPLRLLDIRRTQEPDWFQQTQMIGYVCYTDRFAGTLPGVAEKISYLKELGVTYLHLMPLLRPRSGQNDGGYAVQDYRAVDERLGTMADLAWLSGELRQQGISLCIDLVCNHTAKEHEWAKKARAGDPLYQDYYLMFPDRTLPDEYEKTTPEVFPDFAPGNFTYYPEIERWVWTTFNEYQWDLNYTNPIVLGEMLDIILFLANQGIEILRLDAVAFMWKRLGTDSQNQPEAHAILQLFRALTRLAAPGLLLLAEAIVAPEKLLPYLGQGAAANKECELAYHNVLMVLLWSALAERKVGLLTHTLQQMPIIPTQTTWLTYARCHDDIGWAVTDENAAAVGLNGFAHRAFLSQFYSDHFTGSFARGATFQYNPKTQDRRISGSLASLAGLEKGLEMDNPRECELAIRRILLLHNLILAYGGIPLLYMGDEIGLLNDATYLDDPHLAPDNRWMHRPPMDWAKAATRHDPTTLTGQIFQGIQQFIHIRKRVAGLHAQALTIPVWTHNEQIFGLIRDSPRGRVLILANFSEHPQFVSRNHITGMGLKGQLLDHLTGHIIMDAPLIHLGPYEVMWLVHLGGSL
ncbi:MAG: alpha-amylase [Chloroflexi bacterium]|nr:alpha-amylase [Chloroflexota bacterium]MBP8056141.1 alpha-amylase [Chloroflexota bacterium]